MAQLYFRLQIA